MHLASIAPIAQRGRAGGWPPSVGSAAPRVRPSSLHGCSRASEATVGGPAVYPEAFLTPAPRRPHETTARKFRRPRAGRTADPTTSLFQVDDGAGPQRLHQVRVGFIGTTMWSAPRGNASIVLDFQADLVDTLAEHLLEREGEQPAHLERLRNQQRMLATDTPTTLLAMTHYELPGLGLGWAECRPGTDRCSLSYLTSARALLRARSLEGLVGNWDRSDGLPPVLRPRLASGLLRVPFRLVLEEGCVGLASAGDSSSTLSSLASGRPVPSTDS